LVIHPPLVEGLEEVAVVQEGLGRGKINFGSLMLLKIYYNGKKSFVG
jgi:hypothetical protein